MSTVLEVEGLTVTARSSSGENLLLDDVALTLGSGEIVGVVGESGSGKTTFVRSLVGLLDRNLRVSSGTVELLGEPMLGPEVDRTAALRGRHIGMVFQDASRSLNPVLKVGHQLREVIRTHQPETSRSDARALMVQTLRQMSIADPERMLDSFPHQLSGGQRQRAALALALVTHPELVLADECTTALDVTTQAGVVALLRALVAQQGITLVFVTHDLLLASELCDRIAVMYAGQIVESGPAREVLVRPRHPYTERLLAAIPGWNLERPLQGIMGTPPTVGVADIGCRFAERCQLVQADCRTAMIELTGCSSHVYRCLHPVAPTGSVPTAAVDAV